MLNEAGWGQTALPRPSSWNLHLWSGLIPCRPWKPSREKISLSSQPFEVPRLRDVVGSDREGLVRFSKIDCGRDCAPSDLPPRHPLIPSGRWDTLSSLAFGQGGIRTLGWFYPTHAFQASPIDRSGTCPAIAKHKPNWPLLRVDSPKVVLRLCCDKLDPCQLLFRYPFA